MTALDARSLLRELLDAPGDLFERDQDYNRDLRRRCEAFLASAPASEGLRERVLRALRLSGHRFEPWPEKELARADFQELVRQGEVHPTCSACSRNNNEYTTRMAHEAYETMDDLEATWAALAAPAAPATGLREALEKVLQEHAVDVPENQGLHGWRCQYPDTYGGGPCSCFSDLLDALVAALAAPAAVGQVL